MKEINEKLGNVSIRIYEGGEFKTSEGKTIPFEGGIKVKVGKNGLAFSPRDLLSLKALLVKDNIRAALVERYEAEEEILQNMKF